MRLLDVIVRIPAGDDDLDEAHPALDQAPGQQATAADGIHFGVFCTDSVEPLGRFGLGIDVDGFGHLRLHPER